MATSNNSNDDEIISAINVTPLVDIMLVLLIIFMLVSSFMEEQAIEIDLPHAATGNEIKTETLSILISKNGEYFISGAKIDSFEKLKELLQEKKSQDPSIQVVISADKKVYHEELIKVIDTIRKIGIFKFAINVEYTEETE
ncbi:MAG: biopolymer transporter ExbD [Desulfobacterales bacterium]|nr:biopolymer transporter ExbD [Desulfobacterales bacterium]